MKNGCVCYLENDIKFTFFYGNGFMKDILPKGTRVVYPKKPIKAIKNPKNAINYALEHPLNSKPLSKLLKPGMKVTIAFDDLSLPLPKMKKPDLRQTAIELILKKLEDADISNVHLIAALGLHRKMTKEEFEDMLGKDIVKKFYPDRLYNHDAEDKENIVSLGRTKQGHVVNVNKRVAHSDLLIYVNINFVPMDGGHKSIATGLCDYQTIRHTHNVKALMNSESYFYPENSMLHHILDIQGKLAESRLKTFKLEMTINNDLFPSHLKFLQKRHYEMNALDRFMMNIAASTTNMLSANAQRKISSSIRSNYGLMGAYAGDVEEVHKKSLQDNFRQYEVEVEGQCDILIGGIPDMSPYNVNSILNPVLFVCLVHGYFFNLYKNKPVVKKNGVLIAIHPLEGEFSKLHHPSYIDFYEQVLTKTLDTKEIEEKYEKKFAENQKYINFYRNSYAYHGVHPFYMWYWGCYGLSHIGKTIIVGARNKKVLDILGFEAAKNLKEAIEKAKKFLKKSNPNITCIRVPPLLTVNVK